jgi:hypothetical protein
MQDYLGLQAKSVSHVKIYLGGSGDLNCKSATMEFRGAMKLATL